MPLSQEQLETFPESVRDWDEVKNSDSPEVVWDRLGNMRKKIGTGLYAPSEDAGDEDRAKFITRAVELSDGRLMPRPDLENEEERKALYKALGTPDDATGYEFAEVEGSELDDERKSFIAKIALETGLTKAQLKKLDQELRTREASSLESLKNDQTSKLGELRQEWGLSFEDRVHQAKKVAEMFFPQLSKETNFSAAELKSFHSIAKQLGGQKEFGSQGDQANIDNTPADARAKIAEIRNNPEHPYFDHNKPGHNGARAKMRDLYKIANNIQ